MRLTPSENYCLNEVKRHDHDRYLAALFLPAEKRAAGLALIAFNLEIARTREIVSESVLGQIRLQWWRETIDGLYDGTLREHPVVETLHATIREHDLPREPLGRLIDAREADLEDEPPADLMALESYARDTSGELLALVMRCLASRNDEAEAAARRVGTAWAIIGLARAVGFHAQLQRVYIPEDLLSEYGVERRHLLSLKSSPGLNRAIEAMIDRAESLLYEVRGRIPHIPRPARRGLMLAGLADRHITAIRKANFDPFMIPTVRPAPLLRLTLRALAGRF